MTSIRRIHPPRLTTTYVLLTGLPILTYAHPLPQKMIPIVVKTKDGYLSRIDPITLSTLIILVAMLLAALTYWLIHYEKKKIAKAAEEHRRMEEGRQKADELAQREKDKDTTNGRDWGAPPPRRYLKPDGVAPNGKAPFGEPRSRKTSQLSPNDPSSAPASRKGSRLDKDGGPPIAQAGDPQSRKTSKTGIEAFPPTSQSGETSLKNSQLEGDVVPPKPATGEPQPKRLSSVIEKEEKDVPSSV